MSSRTTAAPETNNPMAAAATFNCRYLIITQAKPTNAIRRRTKNRRPRWRGFGPKPSTTFCHPQKLLNEIAAPTRNAPPVRIPREKLRARAPATASARIIHRTRLTNRSYEPGSLPGIVLIQLANQLNHPGDNAQKQKDHLQV